MHPKRLTMHNWRTGRSWRLRLEQRISVRIVIDPPSPQLRFGAIPGASRIKIRSRGLLLIPRGCFLVCFRFGSRHIDQEL
jgi:hypothetical protein